MIAQAAIAHTVSDLVPVAEPNHMPANDGPPARQSTRRPAFKLTAPTIREHPLHRQIAHALSIEIAPAGRISRHCVMWFSVDASDYGGDVPGTRMARGMVAGIPDVFIIWLGQAHMIELKADDGIASPAQRSIIAGLIVGGTKVATARDAREVLAIVDAWGIPRARKLHL